MLCSSGSIGNGGFAAGFPDHEVTGPLLPRTIAKTYVHTPPPACIHDSLKKQTRDWILFIHYWPSNIGIVLSLINQWQCKHNQVL